MSDYNDLCVFTRAKFATCISQIKHDCKLKGKFILNGSIPTELTVSRPTMYNPNHRDSMHWDSLQEAINAVLSTGVKEFQLPDCSWYGRTS